MIRIRRRDVTWRARGPRNLEPMKLGPDIFKHEGYLEDRLHKGASTLVGGGILGARHFYVGSCWYLSKRIIDFSGHIGRYWYTLGIHLGYDSVLSALDARTFVNDAVPTDF